MQNELEKNAETPQAAAQQDAGCRSKKCSHSNRLDILPGDNVMKKIRSDPT